MCIYLSFPHFTIFLSIFVSRIPFSICLSLSISDLIRILLQLDIHHNIYLRLYIFCRFSLSHKQGGIQTARVRRLCLRDALVALWAASSGSRLQSCRREGLLAGLLFALHPVHCEAVAGIVGHAELLSAAFALTGLLAYVSAARPRDRLFFHWLPFLAPEGEAPSAQLLSSANDFFLLSISPKTVMQRTRESLSTCFIIICYSCARWKADIDLQLSRCLLPRSFGLGRERRRCSRPLGRRKDQPGGRGREEKARRCGIHGY